jgi:hypothetical protein
MVQAKNSREDCVFRNSRNTVNPHLGARVMFSVYSLPFALYTAELQSYQTKELHCPVQSREDRDFLRSENL